MRKPRVQTLKYELVTGTYHSFNNPSPITWETDEFEARLENGFLVCELKGDYSTIGAAQLAVDPYVKAWEIDVALSWGRGEFRFKFVDGEVIDLNPTPPEGNLVTVTSDLTLLWNVHAKTKVNHAAYPNPPQHFTVTPDVATLWQRFEGYADGREPLLSMAFFCLSMVEYMASGRSAACRKFNIEPKVLGELGRLTTTMGDGGTARKLNKGSTRLPLSKKEKLWVESAVKMLIRQVGECCSGHIPQKMTLGLLP